MFLSLTPNPCIERTLRLGQFSRGETRRVASDDIFISLGGKGLNAARVAARFGASVMAIAPAGRRQSTWMRELAHHEGIACDFVEVEADTRFCLNFLHDQSQKTEFVEAGTPFSASEGAHLLEKWLEWLPRSRMAAIGGSYPAFPDSGSQWHATLLCHLANKAGVPLIYDGQDESFRRALSSKTPPWAIKPNLDEARSILGRSIETVAEERRAVRDFLRRGVEVVLLSCGSRGLYVGQRGGIEWFEAPQVKVVSSVGSGDALVGAFAASWLQNGDIFEAARLGVAAGSANAGHSKPAFVGSEDAAALVPLIRRSTQEIALDVST